MIVPPAVLVGCAAVIGLLTRLGPVVQAAAVRFQDQAGYNATVLAGAHIAHPAAPAAAESTGLTVSAVLTSHRLGYRRAGPGLPRAVLASPAAAAARL